MKIKLSDVRLMLWAGCALGGILVALFGGSGTHMLVSGALVSVALFGAAYENFKIRQGKRRLRKKRA